MAEPEASYLARHGVESTITAAVSQVLKEKPLDPLKRIGQLLLGALPGSALQVELSDAAHDLIHANGWRLGMVGFGSPASESTVRVMSAMCIACSHRNSLPDDFSWVELTYDDKPLAERGGKLTMGVRSAEWAELSGGACEMPALLIDGIMYRDSIPIVRMLATACPDETLDRSSQARLMSLLDLAAELEPLLSGALRHWGWAAYHSLDPIMSSPHYSTYGIGKRDAKWENETRRGVHRFFSTLERALPDRPTGYFVADRLTYADCALLSFAPAFRTIVQLNFERRYPKVYANWAELERRRVPGAEGYVDFYQTFGGLVAKANEVNRRRGFHIERGCFGEAERPS